MEIMDKQRRGGSSSSRGGSLIERDNDSNTRNTANKALSFSIEAILSAPHPKRQPTTVKRRPLSRSGAIDSPLLTLADFASNVLPTEKDKELGSNENVSRSMQQKLAAFQARLNARKRRKARTCFTNQQIFELERRFMYQKYLSPADRDEIAQTLGISGAQVITWFQNRRAKFRRDLEELKSDVQAAKIMDTKQVNRLYKRLEI